MATPSNRYPHKDDILKIGQGLRLGVTVTSVCPFCLAHHEKSFSVTRVKNGYLYRCWRVKCDRKGVIPVISLESPKEKEFVPSQYRGELTNPPPKVFDYFREEFGLGSEILKTQQVGYNKDRNTIAFPIFDSTGRCVGIVDRAYSWMGNEREPKAITYWKEKVPMIHFPRFWNVSKSNRIVLVEDIVSANKVKHVANSGSLLGTNLSEEVVKLLLDLGIHRITLAFDPDATEKALKVMKKYQGVVKITVVSMAKDPKNTGYQTLKYLLGEDNEQRAS